MKALMAPPPPNGHEYQETDPYRGCGRCGVGPGAYVHSPGNIKKG